jgi:hypothetical protein
MATMGEMEFTMKVVVFGIFIQVLLFVFANAIGGSPSGVNPQFATAFNTIQNYQGNINTTLHSMVITFDNALIPATNATFYGFEHAYNGVISIINFIANVVTLGINTISLFNNVMQLLFYMVFVFIPAIFFSSNLGAIGVILAIVSAAIPILLVVYAYTMTRDNIGHLIGFIKAII